MREAARAPSRRACCKGSNNTAPANRIDRQSRPYDDCFIVILNIVVQPSLTCISLHASYDESLRRVQRTRKVNAWPPSTYCVAGKTSAAAVGSTVPRITPPILDVDVFHALRGRVP